MTGQLPGLDLARFERWAQDFGLEIDPPFTATRLGGGRSNLTYVIRGASGASLVLRRPPLGPLLATAHDVVREARIISGAGAASLPVPKVLGVCENLDVLRAPFAVLELVEGETLASSSKARQASVTLRRSCGPALVDALARLHSTDLSSMGLADLARPGSYVERQLRRWRLQWDATRTFELASMEVAFSALMRSVPREQSSCLVHGDPKLDNCLLGPDGNLRALVDWELAAAGDPFADLGMLLAYWAEPGDAIVALQDPPSAEPGFARRDELAERYARASGLDVSRLSYYRGFALWKLACIVQGVLRRIVDGALGAHGVDTGPFAAQVVRLGDFAAEVLTGGDRAAG